MKRSKFKGILGAVLAAALVAGSLFLPGTGVTSEAAKSSKKTTAAATKSSKKSTKKATATTTAAAADTATVTTPTWPVQLNASINGTNVVITATAGTVPATDDAIYHLYVQNIWENGTQGTEKLQQPAGNNATFTLPLAKDSAESLLFKKFTVVSNVGGVLTQLSNTAFITNPEAVATKTQARDDSGFKGILPDSAMIVNGFSSVTQMGATEISYNLPVSTFLGSGIQYKFQGKTYNFNRGVVGGYDLLMQRAKEAGINVNMVLLCDKPLLTSAPQYVHPSSRVSAEAKTNYLMFNTADAGAEELEALASFLGDRYPGIENWIVGNEVNAVDLWNGFNGNVANDIVGFTKAYTDEFRIFYNGIKSSNANAKVFIATDQEWQSDNPAIHYGVRDFITEINRQIKEGGDIHWGVSNHPYNFPLFEPNIAALKAKPQVTHDYNTSKYVTMENIEILTDFMLQPQFLDTDGAARTILLSEVGYTSATSMGGNEQLQAADIVYALNRVATNHYIDCIVINRQHSDAGEVAGGLDYGLLNIDGSQKTAYNWYIHAMEPEVVATASAVLGLDITAECQQYAR